MQDDPSLISTDPQMIAIDPRYRFGRPVTNPSLIDIDGIALRVRWGESLEEEASEHYEWYPHPVPADGW